MDLGTGSVDGWVQANLSRSQHLLHIAGQVGTRSWQLAVLVTLVLHMSPCYYKHKVARSQPGWLGETRLGVHSALE